MDTITIDSKQFQQLLDTIEKMSNMLALNLVKDCQKQNEKIVLLSNFGYNPADISRILNTTSNTVSVALSRAKKAKSDIVKEPKNKETEEEVKKANE